jgi:hypothetical protein
MFARLTWVFFALLWTFARRILIWVWEAVPLERETIGGFVAFKCEANPDSARRPVSRPI